LSKSSTGVYMESLVSKEAGGKGNANPREKMCFGAEGGVLSPGKDEKGGNLTGGLAERPEQKHTKGRLEILQVQGSRRIAGD